MKQQISPVMGAILIAITVIFVVFLGYKLFFGKRQGSGPPPPEAAKWINHTGDNMQQHSPGGMGAMTTGGTR